MGRVSIKENKTPYQLTRESLGLSRAAASEKLEWISEDRLERIENQICTPSPDEIWQMSEQYHDPKLCNYYCANQCKIGQECVPEIKIEDLSKIILKMLASLNSVQKKQERLIEIAVDGQISDDEIEDFIHIQTELDRISLTVDTLRLWSEQMLANGSIDKEKYDAILKNS